VNTNHRTRGGTTGIHGSNCRMLTAVRRAAATKAPYAGVPFAPGEYPFVFESSVLRTLAACPKLDRAEILRETVQSFGQKAQRTYLVLWGNGAEYKLQTQCITRDLRADSRYQMQSRWAEGQRVRRATARLSPEARRNKKHAEEIGKLERRLQKLRPYKPEHPLLYKSRPSEAYEREQVSSYVAERGQRKIVAKIAGKYLKDADWRPAKRWASRLYAELAVVGLTVQFPYAKVKNGLSGHRRYQTEALFPDEYCKKLWKWTSLSDKPYSMRASDYDSFDKRLQNYRESRDEYRKIMQERKFIEAQIEAIRGLIESNRLVIQ
jgi:hypothetical protein